MFLCWFLFHFFWLRMYIIRMINSSASVQFGSIPLQSFNFDLRRFIWLFLFLFLFFCFIILHCSLFFLFFSFSYYHYFSNIIKHHAHNEFTVATSITRGNFLLIFIVPRQIDRWCWNWKFEWHGFGFMERESKIDKDDEIGTKGKKKKWIINQWDVERRQWLALDLISINHT